MLGLEAGQAARSSSLRPGSAAVCLKPWPFSLGKGVGDGLRVPLTAFLPLTLCGWVELKISVGLTAALHNLIRQVGLFVKSKCHVGCGTLWSPLAALLPMWWIWRHLLCKYGAVMHG